MDGTPLPNALSGVTVQRLIEIDQALLYLVTGALDFAVINEPLEQTGALTPETAKNALSVMLETYLREVVPMIPVGATMMWHTDTPPDRWIICDGSGYLKAEYPELWALWGTKYGTSPDFFGSPNLTGRFPYGATFANPLDDEFGEADHTLTTAEMPSHSHTPSNGGNFLVNGGTGTKNHQPFAGSLGLAIAATNTQGGGNPHNNIPPALSVIFIAYGGRAP